MSTNDRPSYSSKIFRLFPSEGEKINFAAFCTNRLEVLRRHVCRGFRATNPITYLPVFKIKRNLGRKLDPSPKPSNLKEITYLTNFYAQKAKCPRHF